MTAVKGAIFTRHWRVMAGHDHRNTTQADTAMVEFSNSSPNFWTCMNRLEHRGQYKKAWIKVGSVRRFALT